VLGDREHEVLQVQRGAELAGMEYVPLWDFYAGPDAEGRRGHFTVTDDYVTADEGTGVVHLALYGEDDYRLIKAHDLPRVQHVDDTGHFTAECGPYAGRYFREEGLDVEIMKDLYARGLLYDRKKEVHSYPHCYKCESPLMYHAKSNWFIRTTAVRDEMLRANREINWIPPSIRDGRFGTWSIQGMCRSIEGSSGSSTYCSRSARLSTQTRRPQPSAPQIHTGSGLPQ